MLQNDIYLVIYNYTDKCSWGTFQYPTNGITAGYHKVSTREISDKILVSYWYHIAAQTAIEFQSDRKTLITDPMSSRLCKIAQKDVFCGTETPRPPFSHGKHPENRNPYSDVTWASGVSKHRLFIQQFIRFRARQLFLPQLGSRTTIKQCGLVRNRNLLGHYDNILPFSINNRGELYVST